MEDKELIWVDKKLADEYKSLKSVEQQELLVKKVIEKRGLDLTEELEMLSDNTLQFKSVCLVHRKELEKIYAEESDKLYKLWEEMGDITSKISQHARAVAQQIDPIRREVSELSKNTSSLGKKIGQINLYIPDKLVQIASMVGAMDDKTKTLLRDLLDSKSVSDED